MKALKLLDGGARVMIVGRSFNQGIKKLEKSGRIEVVKIERLESVDIFRVHRPYVVIIATSDADLNYKLFEKAREYGSLICVVDTPYLNDFNMPAIAKIGDIRIAISTGGMSPAMSGLLRKRIEELIKFEDKIKLKGIYEFILTGEPKHLSHRKFPDNIKHRVYEKQNHKCNVCKKTFDISEMEADHKKAWYDNGETTEENCQMLCQPHHYEKTTEQTRILRSKLKI